MPESYLYTIIREPARDTLSPSHEAPVGDFCLLTQTVLSTEPRCTHTLNPKNRSVANSTAVVPVRETDQNSVGAAE